MKMVAKHALEYARNRGDNKSASTEEWKFYFYKFQKEKNYVNI